MRKKNRDRWRQMTCWSRKTTYMLNASLARRGQQRRVLRKKSISGGQTTDGEVEERLNIEFQRHKQDWAEGEEHRAADL